MLRKMYCNHEIFQQKENSKLFPLFLSSCACAFASLRHVQETCACVNFCQPCLAMKAVSRKCLRYNVLGKNRYKRCTVCLGPSICSSISCSQLIFKKSLGSTTYIGVVIENSVEFYVKFISYIRKDNPFQIHMLCTLKVTFRIMLFSFKLIVRYII